MRKHFGRKRKALMRILALAILAIGMTSAASRLGPRPMIRTIRSACKSTRTGGTFTSNAAIPRCHSAICQHRAAPPVHHQPVLRGRASARSAASPHLLKPSKVWLKSKNPACEACGAEDWNWSSRRRHGHRCCSLREGSQQPGPPSRTSTAIESELTRTRPNARSYLGLGRMARSYLSEGWPDIQSQDH
jgi:hypothetical protein